LNRPLFPVALLFVGMKLALILVLVTVAVAMAATTRTLDDELRLFKDFMQTYGRKYTPSEEVSHFKCFRTNLALIDERNAKGGARFAINQFTDMCAEEFAKYYLGLRPVNITRHHSVAAKAAMPKACSAINWSQKGVVTGVKNQGQCGSCWAFSATGNMEGQWAQKHTLVSISEEELVQCSGSAGNQGCNGGWMDQAFQWVITNGGIDSEAAYPYTSGNGYTGTCDSSLLPQHVATLTSYQNLPTNEAGMASWICTGGPISIAVDASSWSSYSGGVMTDCVYNQLDHGVLAVGFDTTASPPYWIVKNSWGASWGEAGYILLEYGTDQCGLTMAPSTSIV